MASVAEIKEAARAEQASAVELAESAISAIDTLLNLSQYVLTILGVIIAIIAIFGYALIIQVSRSAAKRVAKTAADSYIKSQEFGAMMERKVNQEVKRRLDNKFILANLKEDDNDADSPFPKDPKGGEG